MGFEAQRAVEKGQEIAWAQRRRLHRSFTFSSYVFGWSFRFALGMAVMGSMGMASLLMVADVYSGVSSSLQEKGVIAWMMGVCVGGMALAWALLRQINQYTYLVELEQEELEFKDDVPHPPENGNGKRWERLIINGARGQAEVWQPRPGAFAGWLREVIAPENRMQLSWRQARDRGWPQHHYVALVAQLEAIEWISGRRNDAPAINADSLPEIREWLQSTG